MGKCGMMQQELFTNLAPDEFRPTPRVVVQRGDLVCFHGGRDHNPGYEDENGETRSLTLPGTFRVDAIIEKEGRVYLEVTGLKGTFGKRIVFVQGDEYERHCVRWKPYKVKKSSRLG